MKENATPICYIVGAGELNAPLSFVPCESDFVIAADGGLRYLAEAGIRVDLLIGDMDSVQSTNYKLQITNSDRNATEQAILLPVEKNETDLYAAIQVGLQKGYKAFHIYGGLGGSMRHTVASIQCLKMLALKNCRGYLFGNGEVLTAIHNESIAFSADCRGFISVFSLGEYAVGVTLKNLKYPLKNYTMPDIYPVGVSNEFTGAQALVSVQDGTLLLVYNNCP
ncbi:MAG: thiamine diphosphokinase [Firmicutes bacterium]|nr:thiamine diphosphokinase [Bacillota bacterium]